MLGHIDFCFHGLCYPSECTDFLKGLAAYCRTLKISAITLESSCYHVEIGECPRIQMHSSHEELSCVL